MIVKTNSKDALQIAKKLLQEFEPPIGAFVKEEDFVRLKNKDEVEAISSFQKEYAIEELKRKGVIFITYHRKYELLLIEANWSKLMGNNNIVYIDISKDGDEKV